MVSVVENWSLIAGTVKHVRPDPELPDHVLATVVVHGATPVGKPEGGEFPNLFAGMVGTSVDVCVPVALAADRQLAAGRRLTARAKRSTPTRAFVTELSMQ